MTEPTADPFAFLRGLTADQLDAIEATNRAILDAIERYRATVPARRPRARPSPPPAVLPCDVTREEVDRVRAGLRARGVG